MVTCLNVNYKFIIFIYENSYNMIKNNVGDIECGDSADKIIEVLKIELELGRKY